MKNIATKTDKTGTGAATDYEKLPAADANSMISELKNVVIANGQALDENNSQQVAQSITDHALGGAYAEDTGTANNYILSITGSRQTPPVLVKGYRLFFQTGNANTSTTPTLNYAGLGVKTIVAENGTDAIVAGDIKVGVYNEVVYDGTNWCLKLSVVNSASETVLGTIKISTTAQTTAGVDDTTAVTPEKLMAKLLASFTATKTLNNGETKDINGVIFKWGFKQSSSGSSLISQAITFDSPFPTALIGFWGIVTTTNNIGACFVDLVAHSTTGVTYRILERQSNAMTTPTVKWFAIGY